ncbi:e20ec3c9-987c-472b-be09-5eaba6e8d0a9 [Thermothielavioides terrestris]|uniref:E20ec3c9-987c-472b-be09-5eaba6e8d0a9 n=1 Tax=Thermothielavioides terrestris TaxID=2587410 RepID=A0A446BUX9_9PEZI|nr:e20ec3c9-987c-472b-be09-5eaba6e8d0a9 [Thermothielavioides terrestris]
MDIKYTEYIL